MNRPGIVERWQLSQPGVIAAFVAGIVLGVWAGATFKGSGMFFSNLILGGCLLALLVVVALGAIAAAATHRTGAARILAVLVSVTVVATGVAYAIASPYRGPFAGIDHPGSVTVRVVEPVPNEWSAVAICRTRERGSPVFMVETSHGEPGGRTLYVTLNLSPGTTPVQGNLWLQFVTMPASPVRYLPSSGNGLDVTLLDAKGLTGSLRFAAAKEPNPLVSPGPEPARLTGTLEWACEPTPSG